MKLLLPLVLALLTAALPAAAQSGSAPNGPLKELRQSLARARTDSARGRIYSDLGYFSTHGDSAIYFQQQAIPPLQRAVSKAQGTERVRVLRLLATATAMLGSEYAYKNDARSESYHVRALALFKQAGSAKGQVMELYNLAIGKMQKHESSDYAGALAYLQQAVRVGEHEPKARSMVATCLSIMGYINGKLGDRKAQLREMLRAQAMLELSNDATPLLQSLMMLSQTYLDDHGDTARAESYARRAQVLAAKTPGANIGLTAALMARGSIRAKQHRFPAARAFLAEALRHADVVQRRVEINNILVKLEEEAGNVPLALRYARQNQVYAEQDNLEGRRTVERTLARLYEKLGQPQQALTHFRRYIALRDSLQSEDRQKAGFRQKLSYDYERKEATLKAAQEKRQAVAAAEIRRQKQLRVAATGGVGLLLLLALVLFNRFRYQRRATAAITREKARSDELLRNILPAEVAAELMETGKTTARQHDLVTVLFADVVGFTQHAEKLTAQELVAALDTYFAAFDALTSRFGLEKIKTIGDAYMLAGGLGQGTTADPASVVRAALAMLATVEALRAARAPQGLPCFALRIGLHTGPVVAGVVGVKKFAYDIWGDTVNTAARMESSGAPGHVNVSEATYDLVATRFVCVARGQQAAKNKGELAMYFVEGERELEPAA